MIEYRTEVDDSYRTKIVKEKEVEYDCSNFDSPKKIVALMNEVFRMDKLAEEYVYLLCMNSKNRLIGVFEIGHGTADASLVSPRDVFMKSLMVGAVNIVVVHNHPSGVTCPSNDDLKTYDALKKASELIKIKMIDFIIIGRNDFTSFAEKE